MPQLIIAPRTQVETGVEKKEIPSSPGKIR